MSVYVGIDPGKKGAMAVIHEDGSVTFVPFDREAYRDTLAEMSKYPKEPWKDVKCCVEHVGAAPGNGTVSMFAFGENFGFIQGLLTAYGIPYELVRPAKWKKEFSVTKDKNTSIEVCKRLFPNVYLKRTERCKTDSSDIAEALLMAEYARRHM